jgi:hypothetical protein
MAKENAYEEGASEKERTADQQFGAQAARDQEAADKGEMDSEKIAETPPRAGNKEDDIA